MEGVPSIIQVERLIEELYGSSDAQVAKHIQGQLQQLQKQTYAWEIASQILSSQSQHCRFFGAHTFQVKITRDWDTLPEDRIEWLRDELLGWLIRYCQGPIFVTTKICVALIAYAFRTVPNQWPHFITNTLAVLESQEQTYGAVAIQNTVMEFLRLVPEEVTNATIIGGRKLQLIGELKESTSFVLTRIYTRLYDTKADIAIQQKSLVCLTSWIQYGIDLESVYPLLQKVMILLGDETLFDAAVEVLLESMQQASWAKYQNYRNELLACFTSPDMKNKFAAAIEEQDEETARSLAKLFTAFGENYTDYIVIELSNVKIQDLLNMTLQLTGFQGYFPIDQEVSDIPLNFWYILQETLFDENVLPMINNNSNAQIAIVLYQELVKILIHDATYPSDAVWNTWNKDIKDKFKIWRRDLGDTMINPYYVLKDDMLSILLNYCIEFLSQPEMESEVLEAIFFALKSISEEVSPTENQYISKFFDHPHIIRSLLQSSNVRLKNTILLWIGSLAEWFKQHPQHLNCVMNYVSPCLSDPLLAPAASSAFADFCDTCRHFLVDELTNLMHVYNSMTNSHIKSNIMQKVIESVADVIQVLSPEKAVLPLMSLINDIIQNISKAIFHGDKELIIVQLNYLSACCRGIQSPTDEYQSITERNSTYDLFASGQLITLYSSIEGFNEVTFAIRQLSIQIATDWHQDEEGSKALSHFLELGLKSTSPLLSLNFLDLTTLIETSYTMTPYSCWLNTASFIMNVYGAQRACQTRLRDLLAVLTTKTIESIPGTEAMEHYPDIVDSYFGLLSKAITRCPIAFYQLPVEMMNTIFLFVIAGMGLQERLALKSALNFMADFVSQDYNEESEMSRMIDNLIMNMGMQMMEQLLLGIGGRVPRSFSGPLVDVLYKIIGKYLQPSRQWMHSLLSTEGFPSALATTNDKETFCKGVLGTRSLKRFKEAANIFSIKCRGLGNTSF